MPLMPKSPLGQPRPSAVVAASADLSARLLRWVVAAGLLVSAWALLAPHAFAGEPRQRLSLDTGWKFHLGDPWPEALRLDKAGVSSGPAASAFDDAAWREIQVPHDWAVELPFDPAADRNHGYKALGARYPENSIAWYRRSFDLPADDVDKRIWLTFDGIFRDATVWVNGWLVKRHESGYSPLREDITDVLNLGGRNTIAVRVDATKFEGWFYEGAGLYRHVWLEKTAPLAIAPDGVFVYAEVEHSAPKTPATIQLRTVLLNSSRSTENADVLWSIVAPDGRPVAEGSGRQSAHIAAGAHAECRGSLEITSPDLWSPEDPRLYRLVTTVSSDGAIVDRQETIFGIRTVGFDPNIGFLLNGQRYEIHGTCNHQDHAGVGVAIPDALSEFRVRRLKEFGCNAYRTAHHPPTPELLEICDRLGMLVMDESRLLGSDSENLRKWEELIRRDRNHPSVVIWSIANEELAVHDTPQAARVAGTMQDVAKHLDPTRPVTYAANQKNVFLGINSVIEVRGWNYHLGPHVDDYHSQHPQQPIVGTEQASVVGTRGIYANDYGRGHVSSYDIEWPGWDTTAESWWTFFAERPWLSGAFAWTGFDYRGEPSPCNWPSISSHFGILDTCGFAKDSFYYYQSWWTTQPVLHLAPHWNWAGREGEEILVQAFSNCAAVELFLNGVSQGRQPMKRFSKLFWRDVRYAPGTLSAKGYDAAGQVVTETRVETTGDAVQIRLTPDRSAIDADGEDVAVFTVSAVDAEGRVVPLAQNKVDFTIEGSGRIIGVGNGDPNCHEPDTFVSPQAQWSRSLFNGLAQVIVQSTRDAGEFRLTARADGLTLATLAIHTQPCPLRPYVP